MTERSYETSELRVRWQPSRCVHSAVCLDALPKVFDTSRRPWVDLSAADAQRIAEAIRACPSGALSYERADGSSGEEPSIPTTIVPARNGPLYVRGRVEILDEWGNELDVGYRMALCRCGQSANQPFCDLSHRRTGFRSQAAEVAAERRDADSPEDIRRLGQR